MKVSAVAALFVGMIGRFVPAGSLIAQENLTVAASPIVITPPDSTAYASGLSATTATTVTLNCLVTSGGSTGCEVDWTYTGSTFLLDYQVSGASTDCVSGTNTGSLVPVPTGTAVKLAATSNKNTTCSFTLTVRVHNLSITTFLSGVTYLQALTLTAKRL